MAKKIPIKINPKKTALMIIDMQNDFTENRAILEIPNIRESFLKLKKFIDICRSKKITIIYTRHTYSPKNNPIEAYLFPELDKIGLRKNTHGWEINDYLWPQSGDIVINKTRYDAFYKTSLEGILKKKGITNIIITGTMTEVCCESTVRSAMFRDYIVWMLSDFNFTSDEKKRTYALKTISSNFGWVVKSGEILKFIKK